MRSRVFLALLLVATATFPATATAVNESTTGESNPINQSNGRLVPASPEPPNSTGARENTTSNATAPIPIEPIDPLTGIESTKVESGQMVLVIHSDVVQRVVLTDAGAVWQGGEIPQRDYTLQPGSNRLKVPVTEVSGRVAVTIATRRVLYSTVIVTNDPLIGGPFDRGDVQQAALAGLVAGVGVTALIAYKRVRGTSDAPERVI